MDDRILHGFHGFVFDFDSLAYPFHRNNLKAINKDGSRPYRILEKHVKRPVRKTLQHRRGETLLKGNKTQVGWPLSGAIRVSGRWRWKSNRQTLDYLQ